MVQGLAASVIIHLYAIHDFKKLKEIQARIRKILQKFPKQVRKERERGHK